MKSKRQARVFAMQSLYAFEVGGVLMGDAISSIEESLEIHIEQKKYGMKLIDLCQEHLKKTNDWIESYSEGWTLERIAVIDRIILRLALVELSLIPEVPPKVAIKEAVEVSRKYSSADASGFINGILDKFAKDNFILSEEN